MALPIPEVWTVYGNAFLFNGNPFTQGKIKAFDVSLSDDSQPWQGYLGETGFNPDGSYNITYPRSSFQLDNTDKTHPELQLRIYDYQDRLLWQSAVVTDPLTDHNLNASLSGEPITIIVGGNTVFGKAVNGKNLPLTNYQVNAYAVNFTSSTGFEERPIGTCYTGNLGDYLISYESSSVSGFSALALYAELIYDKEEQEDNSVKFKHILSPLVYNASVHQILNFVLDRESETSISEFDGLNETESLGKYLAKVLKVPLPSPAEDSEQKRLEAFLLDPPLVQYTISAEAKDSHYVECYFRAHLFAYELQERFDVAYTNQSENESPYPESRYAASNYVKYFYALLRSKMISKSDDLIKQNPVAILNCLLVAISGNIIDKDSDVKGFIDLWNELFQTVSGDEPSEGDWTMYHILLLALNNSLSPNETNKDRIAELLGIYYESGSDARLFLETVRPVEGGESPLSEEEWTKIEFILDLGDFGENYRDIIQATFEYIAALNAEIEEENKNKAEGEPKRNVIKSLEDMLVLTEDKWKEIVAKASELYVNRTYVDPKTGSVMDPLPDSVSGTLPKEFTGANGAEQQAIYARKLHKGLLAWFPQAEIVSSLSEFAGNSSEWEEVGYFLSNPNKPPYSLADDNLDVYLKANYPEKEEGSAEDEPGEIEGEGQTEDTSEQNKKPSEGAQDKIRWLQRLFRLTEHLPSIVYLVSQEIRSAYEISQISEDCFLAEHSVGLGGMDKARHIHRLAVNYTMNASFLVSQYNAKLAMHGDSMPAVSKGLTPEGAVAPQVLNTNVAPPRVSPDVIANWKNLFGTINRNAAVEGQSILSPSAYLIDLLEFLGEGKGRDLLYKRRPDFWNLDLTKGNAETALPMIDLAIELLEALAAEKPLICLKNQTTGTSEDLRAQPDIQTKGCCDDSQPDIETDENGEDSQEPKCECTEAIPAAAAKKLLSAVYPFALPENFSREEARLILEKLGLSWRDLALAFPPENDNYQRRHLLVDAVLEKVLRQVVTEEEQSEVIIEDEQSENANEKKYAFDVWELWGLNKTLNTLFRPDKATKEENKDWDYILSIVAVFLDRSGLTLDELRELLALPTFERSGIKIYASAEAAQLGDINGYYLTIDEDGVAKYSVTEEFAYNVSRFVRLRRLLGWSFEEIDAAWELDLDGFDMAQDLSKALKISALEVIFWQRNMTASMFARVFKPLTCDAEILELYKRYEDENFAPIETETETGTETKNKTVKMDLFVSWLCGRLGISRADLDLLMEKTGIIPKDDDIVLEDNSRLQIEKIYRISSFAKALKLSVSDFFKLAEWLDFEWRGLADCLQFSAKVQELRTNPLSYANILKLAFAQDEALQKKGENFVLSLAKAMDALREQHKIPEIPKIPDVSEGSEKVLENAVVLHDVPKIPNVSEGSEETFENAVTACLSILGVDGTDEVSIIKTTEEDSELLPEENKEELASWLQLLNENGVIAISDTEIEALLDRVTVAERLQGLYSRLVTAIKTKLEIAVLACLSILGVDGTDEVSIIKTTEEDSELLPEENKEELASWLQLLNENGVIAISDTEIEALLDRATVAERLQGLHSRLVTTIKTKLEIAVLACLSILEAGGIEEVSLIQATKEDSEALPDGNRDALELWLQLLNENGVIAISDTEIGELLDRATVAGRMHGLCSYLTPAVKIKLKSALASEVLSQLMSHFSLTEEVVKSLLQNDDSVEPEIRAVLRSLDDSNVAWEDWIEITVDSVTEKVDTAAVEDTDTAVADDIDAAVTYKVDTAAYIRLSKASLLVSALKLGTPELLRASLPKFAADILNNLPIRENESRIEWDAFLPLLQVLRVLNDLDFQEEGYDKLIAVNDTKTNTYNDIHLKKWNLKKAELGALLDKCKLNETPSETENGGFEVLAKWLRFSMLLSLFRTSYSLPGVLEELLSAIEMEGDGSEANPYTKDDIDKVNNYIKITALLRRNTMGSMSPAGWREFIQPVNDGLRIRKRDALAAYICWKSQRSSDYYPLAFFDTNDLYSYYLTDVEMNPDMSGSRILQALNSIQQFVQRSLLGLEGKFTLTEEQKGYWEWMKNYRVWEAGRKVFLYAENWIEPELRDDKTPFFKELEDKLMEVSDSPEFMEEALSEYLGKMRDVGGLQIVGACKEDGSGLVLYVLHVLGRTREEPGVYYHRRYFAKALHGGEWTPWEKIDAEIQAASVSMAIMNGNLYLFWPIIQHKEEEAETQEEETTMGANFPKSILELRLNWSFYNGKKWSGKKTTKSALSHVLYDGFGHKLNEGESYEDWYHFSTRNNSSDILEVKVYRTWYDYDMETRQQWTTVAKDGTKTVRVVPVYDPTEYQMIEEFGEFHLWKDGHDEAIYYGNKWDRLNSANYSNSYPPANASLVHNFWMDDGEPESYDEIALPPTLDEMRDREPQPPKRKYGAQSILKYIEERKAWRLQRMIWQMQYNFVNEINKTPEVQLLRARDRISSLIDDSEFGKLVYPKGNIILNKIDGPYSLYPVNFSFYSKEKLPFFFMNEDKTYLIEEVARDKGATTGTNGNSAYRFSLLTHSLVDEFHKRYRSGGREYLYNRETEAMPMAEGYYRSYSNYNYYFSVLLGYHIAGDWEAWDLSQSLFEYRYQPVKNTVPRPFPSPVVDFSWGSANGIYNWELFFHVPMRIAGKLTQEQRYEEAMDWLHMVFDPRMDFSAYERTKRWAQALPKGSRFWRFLPFFANKDADATILETLGMPSDRNKTPERDAIEALTDKWRSDPFNPHLIARARPAAYQKYVVMKYLDNLIAWADKLFTTDTMESINEAIQLYMLAAEILGPKGADAGEVTTDAINVDCALKAKKNGLGNIMIQIEDNLFKPNTREKTLPQLKLSAEAGQLVNLSSSMFYFGVPRNDKLLAYWDTVADRLYKIRNSLNIDGIKRTLALYAPPIDPALLVRVRAMGLDISSALSALNAPLPLYRFHIILQKAMEVVRDVQSLGATLISTLEKKDGEALSLMRAEHEREMLTLNKAIRQLQIDEANAHLESMQKNKESAETRYNFYKNIEKYSTKEILAMSLTGAADLLQLGAAGTLLGAGIAAVAPDLQSGVVGTAFGGPYIVVVTGGSKISKAASVTAESLQIGAQLSRSAANMIQTMGGYDRRWADWKLQEQLAKTEMESLDKQILSAEIRIYMAEKEMANLERQIEQSDEIYDFMTNRFTGQELYTWMATELGRLYNDTFRQALTVARNAERCYNFELGNDKEPKYFIGTDYWDGLRQGLLAGERLLADLRRMDISFLEKNKREFEITRPVSLLQLNPGALRSLQENGECTFKVPEVLFDMDFPGQYFRRIKSVRLEIPCNIDSHSSISAKLSLLSNKLRFSDKPGDDYGAETNYLPNRIGIQSIATSQAQNDGGMFEMNFRDERYLPFEGAGAISEWRLELPKQFKQFDYHSISDAVLHISYTARDSGGLLKNKANENIAAMWDAYETVAGKGLVQEICLSRHDYDSLQQLRAGLPATLQIETKDFPTFAEGASVKSVNIYAKARNGEVSGFKLGIKLDDIVKQKNTIACESKFGSDKWTEIWNSGDIDVAVQGKWQFDASENSEKLLNNLGDIMIEYRYHLNGGN